MVPERTFGHSPNGGLTGLLTLGRVCVRLCVWGGRTCAYACEWTEGRDDKEGEGN